MSDMISAPQEMSELEARRAVNAIQQSVAEIGRYLLDLRQRQGWKALGYRSFTAMLEGEFTYSRQHLYRLMNGAQPKELSHNVTTWTPNDAACLAEAEARINAGLQRLQQGRDALEKVRAILEPKRLYESWCQTEFGMTPDDLIASFDLEAVADS